MTHNALQPAEVFPPGDFILEELEARGWRQQDLAAIMGRFPSDLNRIIKGKVGITEETAQQLGDAFGTGPEYWLNLQNQYALSRAPKDDAVARRARVFSMAPIRELRKRGWIRDVNDPGDIEAELKRFYCINSLDVEPQLAVAARQSVQADFLSGEQIAWCMRAYHLAKGVHAAEYSPDKLKRAIQTLRALAKQPDLVASVPKVLADGGVRLVLIEHLQKSRIDGAAIQTERGPLVALSLRYDRIDHFWHTLMHELSHVLHGDTGIDVDLSDSDLPWAVSPEIEQRANAEAANMLIPTSTMQSFIVRVKPLYSKKRIIQFANLHGIHPGIVVGQLQHRKEIKYQHNREMLVPVNRFITGVALTDGWGHMPHVN